MPQEKKPFVKTKRVTLLTDNSTYNCGTYNFDYYLSIYVCPETLLFYIYDYIWD